MHTPGTPVLTRAQAQPPTRARHLASDGSGPDGGERLTKAAKNRASEAPWTTCPPPAPLPAVLRTLWALIGCLTGLCAPGPVGGGRDSPPGTVLFLRILSAGNVPGEQSPAPSWGLMFPQPRSQRAHWLRQVGLGCPTPCLAPARMLIAGQGRLRGAGSPRLDQRPAGAGLGPRWVTRVSVFTFS